MRTLLGAVEIACAVGLTTLGVGHARAHRGTWAAAHFSAAALFGVVALGYLS